MALNAAVWVWFSTSGRIGVPAWAFLLLGHCLNGGARIEVLEAAAITQRPRGTLRSVIALCEKRSTDEKQVFDCLEKQKGKTCVRQNATSHRKLAKKLR
jgi:hypothetical protein